MPVAGEAGNDTERIRSAIVKIRNTNQRANYEAPWEEHDFSRRRGSGVIISGNRILTSAHVVSDSKYLEIEKEKSGTPYRGVVSFIGHDCDLALIDVLVLIIQNQTFSAHIHEWRCRSLATPANTQRTAYVSEVYDCAAHEIGWC